MLEYSAVPIPANPEALNELAVRGFEVAEESKDVENLRKSLAEKEAVPTTAITTVETKEKVEVVEEEKTVIAHKKYSLAPEDTAWDGSAEVKKADVKDLKIMCTWYDNKDKEDKGAYKLPHHKQDGYSTVWNGVKAAMGALMGARGGLNVPESDRKGIYNHLSAHYKEFGKEVPAFKTMEELNADIVDNTVNQLADARATIESLSAENIKLTEKFSVLETALSVLQNSMKDVVSKVDYDKVVKELEETKTELNELKKGLDAVAKSLELNNLDTIREINKNKKPDETSGSWVKRLTSRQ
jgi:hypothetical protein